MKQQLGVCAVLVALLPALGEARGAQVPWPPDNSNLGFFIGKWSVVGEMRQGNGYGAPVGKFTYTDRYHWRDGRILVEMNRRGRGPYGDFNHSFLYGYNLTTRRYSVIGRDWFSGTLMSGDAVNNGDTWKFASVGYLGNLKYVHERCTLTASGRDAYTVQCETSRDGSAWSPAFEAKATRQ